MIARFFLQGLRQGWSLRGCADGRAHRVPRHQADDPHRQTQRYLQHVRLCS